jgi:hypothetical protein
MTKNVITIEDIEKAMKTDYGLARSLESKYGSCFRCENARYKNQTWWCIIATDYPGYKKGWAHEEEGLEFRRNRTCSEFVPIPKSRHK